MSEKKKKNTLNTCPLKVTVIARYEKDTKRERERERAVAIKKMNCTIVNFPVLQLLHRENESLDYF